MNRICFKSLRTFIPVFVFCLFILGCTKPEEEASVEFFNLLSFQGENEHSGFDSSEDSDEVAREQEYE